VLRMQAQKMGLVKAGERVVVSQCPRLLPDGHFGEAAVVKFVVAGEDMPRHLPKMGSCMDIQAVRAAQAHHAGHCTPASSTPEGHASLAAAHV
jgi:hypothetical protein